MVDKLAAEVGVISKTCLLLSSNSGNYNCQVTLGGKRLEASARQWVFTLCSSEL